MVWVPDCIIAAPVFNKGIRGREFSELGDGWGEGLWPEASLVVLRVTALPLQNPIQKACRWLRWTPPPGTDMSTS